MNAYLQPLFPAVLALFSGAPIATKQSTNAWHPKKVLHLLTGKQPLIKPGKAIAPRPISAETFLAQNADLFGLSPSELSQQLHQRLQAQPVQYINVLTGTALLRAFISTGDAQTHYALLLEGWTIVGLIAINPEQNRLEESGPLLCYSSETRSLIKAIITTGADKLLLATTRTDTQYAFDASELTEVERLTTALEVFDVELLDYLLFYDTMNVSNTWAMYQQEGLDNGVTIEALQVHGVTSSANPSLINS